MAMIFEMGLPEEDLSSICTFMGLEGEGDIPNQLTPRGEKVLDRITNVQKGPFQVTVGRFEQYKRFGVRRFEAPDGEVVTSAYALLDSDGEETGQWGRVIEDYETPDDAYLTSLEF